MESNGDMSTEINKRTNCDETTGGRYHASYAIGEYHHMLRKDSQYDRSASYAVRDGDSAFHSLPSEETGSNRDEDV